MRSVFYQALCHVPKGPKAIASSYVLGGRAPERPADATFRRPSSVVVLDPEALKNLHGAVIHTDRHVDPDLAEGDSEELAHAAPAGRIRHRVKPLNIEFYELREPAATNSRFKGLTPCTRGRKLWRSPGWTRTWQGPSPRSRSSRGSLPTRSSGGRRNRLSTRGAP